MLKRVLKRSVAKCLTNIGILKIISGNCMASGYRFSTYDRDNDGYVYYCMVAYSQSSGAGWYYPCAYVDLNNNDINNMQWGTTIFVKSVMMIQRQ